MMAAHQPRKRFGQHFLHDISVLERMVDVIRPQPGQTLVEIGPGTGALTTLLLPRLGRMMAVELDRDLITPLATRCQALGELRIESADALRFDFRTLAPAQGRLRIVGNLPYNISTPLLFHLLEQAEVIEDMHFLLQKEVVERLAAAPGGGDYGRLSVMMQYHCKVEALFHVGPQAFSPPPRVDSAFVRLVPQRPKPVQVEAERLAQVVAAAFQHRRKTLHNNLKGLLDDAALRDAGLEPAQRAETVTLAQFATLAQHLKQ